MNDFIEKFKALPKEKRTIILDEIEKNGRQYNIFPLSTEQSQMWVLYQLDKESPYYSVPMYIHASNHLKLDSISRAICKICDANTVLKSVIFNVDGQAYVYINRDSYPQIRRICFDSKKDALNHMECEYRKPFNLEEEIPIRVIYYEISDGTSLLFFNVHHMFVDAYSGNIIFDTFIKEYSNLEDGIDNEMKASKYQYSDFSIEQKQWDYEKERVFWCNYLKDASFHTNLPYSYPESVFDSRAGTTISFTVKKDCLVELCKRIKVSCYAYLLGVYYILLSKVCEQDNLTIGTPTLNRNAKTEKMIGYFSNTIPINAEVKQEQKFIEFVQNLNSANIDCLDNAKLPFAKIVELNSAHRDDLTNPIFQTMFTYHGKTINFQQVYDVNKTVFSINDINERMDVQFDLLCTVVESKDDIVCNFTYRNSRFSDELMKRMVDLFASIYNETVSNTQLAVGDISSTWSYAELNSELPELCSEILNSCEEIVSADVCFYNNCIVVFYDAERDVSREYFKGIVSKKYRNEVIIFRVPNVGKGCVKLWLNDLEFASRLSKAIKCRAQLASRNAIVGSYISLCKNTNSGVSNFSGDNPTNGQFSSDEPHENVSILINCLKGNEYSYYSSLFGREVNIQLVEAAAREKTGPVNPIEQNMIAIWCRVLDKDDISVTDSFFALGGNSLKCIKLADEISTSFNCDFNIATLFKYSNIRDLSKYLSEFLDISFNTEDTDSDNIEEI